MVTISLVSQTFLLAHALDNFRAVERRAGVCFTFATVKTVN